MLYYSTTKLLVIVKVNVLFKHQSLVIVISFIGMGRNKNQNCSILIRLFCEKVIFSLSEYSYVIHYKLDVRKKIIGTYTIPLPIKFIILLILRAAQISIDID